MLQALIASLVQSDGPNRLWLSLCKLSEAVSGRPSQKQMRAVQVTTEAWHYAG